MSCIFARRGPIAGRGDIQPALETTVEDFARAIEAVARVLAVNEPTYRGRWRHQSVDTHAEHCRAHCEAWVEGHGLEDLSHAATRALMALELALRDADRPEDAALRSLSLQAAQAMASAPR